MPATFGANPPWSAMRMGSNPVLFVVRWVARTGSGTRLGLVQRRPTDGAQEATVATLHVPVAAFSVVRWLETMGRWSGHTLIDWAGRSRAPRPVSTLALRDRMSRSSVWALTAMVAPFFQPNPGSSLVSCHRLDPILQAKLPSVRALPTSPHRATTYSVAPSAPKGPTVLPRR